MRNDTQSLAIKILSVLGGILASLAFCGFLFIAKLFNSGEGLMAFGIIFVAGAIYTSKKFDKKIIFDTLVVSFFVIGFLLLGLAFAAMDINENLICVLFIVIAFLSIIIAQNYILSFISTLIISGSILSLILLNDRYELIHIYIVAFVVIITYFFLNEAKIIMTNKTLPKLYTPIRIGLTFSFLAGLAFVCKKGLFPLSTQYIWLSSIATISAVIYLLYNLFKVLNINKIQHQIPIYIFALFALLPTAFSPAISGSILLILLSFYVNYKTGLVLGIVAFIYFIAQYYYDLDFTLLTKSILLFSSGVLFLAFYLFIHKKLTINEKI